MYGLKGVHRILENLQTYALHDYIFLGTNMSTRLPHTRDEYFKLAMYIDVVVCGRQDDLDDDEEIRFNTMLKTQKTHIESM